MEHANAIAAATGTIFRDFMLDQFVPRIRRCVELLSEDEVWHKPSAHGNSVANLLLHLAGNVRQWVIVGLGGAADTRDRDGEFAAERERCDATPLELVDRLEAVVREAAEVVDALTPERMIERIPFQGGRFEETGLYGVMHVVEHFSGHTGQIIAYTKQLRGVDLRFYDL